MNRPVFSILLLGAAAIVGAALATSVFVWGGSIFKKKTETIQPGAPQSTESSVDASCNALGIQVHGSIVAGRDEIPLTDMMQMNDGSGQILTPNYTIASDVEYYTYEAQTNPQIKGVIIDVNSWGGGPAASQQIARAIKRIGKPVIGVIHEAGDSGGYLVAASSDHLFALPGSDVGSIGATESYISQVEKNKKEGLSYVELASGPFKDMLNPNRPLSDTEKKRALADLKTIRDQFVSLVAEYRHLPTDKVDALADGGTYVGSDALAKGLIDDIGGIIEAKTYLEGKIGTEANICWY